MITGIAVLEDVFTRVSGFSHVWHSLSDLSTPHTADLFHGLAEKVSAMTVGLATPSTDVLALWLKRPPRERTASLA